MNVGALWVPSVTLCMLALVAPSHHFDVIPLAPPMPAWASWLLNSVQIVHFMPFYAQNYAQNYALIMQNYALVIMLYAQLCKRDLLMHRTMTEYAHYVTSYAIICPNYAQLCTIMLKLCSKLCIDIIMPRNVQWAISFRCNPRRC